MATAGLAFKSCTAGIFKKLLKANATDDNVLYFVTPDTEALANTYGIQTATLYRGSNIVEDSNVIFVRDKNMPTYLDTDTDTIYYRHHCMESYAQSLTSTITGTPGQKLYILFIDAIETSPTFNQVIDAFLYIWQTDIAVTAPVEFTCRVTGAFYKDHAILDTNWNNDSNTDISHITKFGFNNLYTIRGFKRTVVDNFELATIYFNDGTSGISITGDDCYGQTSDTYLAVEASYLSTTLDVKNLYDNAQPIVAIQDTNSGFIENLYEVLDSKSSLSNSWIITNISDLSDAHSFSLSLSTNNRPDSIKVYFTDVTEGIFEQCQEGQIISFIETSSESSFIGHLYTVHNSFSRDILAIDHDVLTAADGCWLGFCIKNDTSDIFQLVDSVYKANRDSVEKIKDLESDVIDIQAIYKDSSIEYPNGTIILSSNTNGGTFTITGHIVPAKPDTTLGTSAAKYNAAFIQTTNTDIIKSITTDQPVTVDDKLLVTSAAQFDSNTKFTHNIIVDGISSMASASMTYANISDTDISNADIDTTAITSALVQDLQVISTAEIKDMSGNLVQGTKDASIVVYKTLADTRKTLEDADSEITKAYTAADENLQKTIVGTDSDTIENNTLKGVINYANNEIKSIRDLLDALEDTDVITTQPYISLTTNIKAYEVGTNIVPNYTIAFNGGAYQYGPAPTGCSAQTWYAKFNGVQKDTNTGTFDSVHVLDNTNLQIEANCTYSEGEVPLSDLGREIPNSRIKAGTTAKKTATLTGFRQAFAGGLTSKTIELDSKNIRLLSGKGANTKTFDITISKDSIRVAMAFPTSWGSLKSVLDVNDSNKNIVSAFGVANPVSVSGATDNEDMLDYKLYIMDFASAYGGSGNTYKVTIG